MLLIECKGHKQKDTKLKVLSAISDDYCRLIIGSTMEEPKSVFDIVVSCNIPIATAYRKIHYLRKSGILKVEKSVITDDGKRYDLYKSNIKAVRIIFGFDSLDIDITENLDMEKSAYW